MRRVSFGFSLHPLCKRPLLKQGIKPGGNTAEVIAEHRGYWSSPWIQPSSVIGSDEFEAFGEVAQQ